MVYNGLLGVCSSYYYSVKLSRLCLPRNLRTLRPTCEHVSSVSLYIPPSSLDPVWFGGAVSNEGRVGSWSGKQTSKLIFLRSPGGRRRNPQYPERGRDRECDLAGLNCLRECDGVRAFVHLGRSFRYYSAARQRAWVLTRCSSTRRLRWCLNIVSTSSRVPTKAFQNNSTRQK